MRNYLDWSHHRLLLHHPRVAHCNILSWELRLNVIFIVRLLTRKLRLPLYLHHWCSRLLSRELRLCPWGRLLRHHSRLRLTWKLRLHLHHGRSRLLSRELWLRLRSRLLPWELWLHLIHRRRCRLSRELWLVLICLLSGKLRYLTHSAVIIF